MVWNEPMAQFSWRKAFTYGSICFLTALVLQLALVLPGTFRWLNEERQKRDQSRIIQEYRLNNDKLSFTVLELQRQLAERDQTIQRQAAELEKLRATRRPPVKP